MQKYIGLALLMLAGLCLFQPEPIAQACSGSGQTSIEGNIESADIMVKAVVVDADDMHKNGVLWVQEYLIGSGAQYLRISQKTEGHFWAGGLDCSPIKSIRQGDSGYFFLRRNYDGSYQNINTVFDPKFYFPTPASVVTILANSEPYQRDLTEIELRALVTDLRNSTPVLPDLILPYPLPSPLLLKTDQDTLYELAIDSDIPLELGRNIQEFAVGQNQVLFINSQGGWLSDRLLSSRVMDFNLEESQINLLSSDTFSACFTQCPSFVPHYNFFAHISEPDHIMICFISDCSWGFEISGSQFVVSPQGDQMAVWENNTVFLYQVRNEYGRFSDPANSLIKKYALRLDGEQLLGKGIWSPDGTWLAFSDMEGLWLWDIAVQDHEPTLLIPSENGQVPLPIGFSGLGRYLYITQNDENFVFDIRANVRLPYSLISPDERFIMEVPEDLSGKFIWTGNRSGMGVYRYYGVMPGSVYEGIYFTDEIYEAYERGYDFAYEPITGTTVILNDPTTISIDNRTIELADDLDGEIVHLEWLPMIWYEE